MEESIKIIKKLEKKWGIEAWNDLMKVFYTYQRKIEDLTKSRDLWKKKHDSLKSTK